jgi:NAD(P)-dependent dehydrogenase (short-subunit alcohol dehydrogenase family)
MTKPTAIITGSGALATAFAKKLSNLNWQVAILSRKKSPDFDGLFYECDFTQTEQVVKAVALAQKDLGEISAAIHTAVSPIVRKRALDISVEDFETAFSVDVFGGFAFLQSVGRLMKQQGQGRIVALLTEAIEGKAVPAAMAGYVSAKFAVKGLLKVLHQELEASNIAVSALAPGFMDTPLNSDLPPRLIEFMKEQQGGKLTTPENGAEVLYQVLTLPPAECAGKTFFVQSNQASAAPQSSDF